MFDFEFLCLQQAYLGLPQVKETCEQLSWQDIRLHTEGIRGHLEAFIAQLQVGT